MVIFSIESSCDETAAAVVIDGVIEVCSVVASSKELHEKTGGIVPEIAARKQVEFVVPVINETLDQYKAKGGSVESVDAVAVTVGPGLIGSLVVGVEAAKSLALAWNKPLIPVNHLVGHVYANFLAGADGVAPTIEFPAVVLLVSGGHTDLVLMRGHGDFEYIGGTFDDAAGEAFDKTARILGYAKYLGAVELSKKAAAWVGNTPTPLFPRPMLGEANFDFSFSGLKTAAKRVVDSQKYPADLVAKEFESAVVDVLVGKTLRAAKTYGAKSILLGGGVSANRLLREKISQAEIPVHIPPLRLCTDNAVYIAAAAFFNQRKAMFSEIVADPSLGIMD